MGSRNPVAGDAPEGNSSENEVSTDSHSALPSALWEWILGMPGARGGSVAHSAKLMETQAEQRANSRGSGKRWGLKGRRTQKSARHGGRRGESSELEWADLAETLSVKVKCHPKSPGKCGRCGLFPSSGHFSLPGNPHRFSRPPSVRDRSSPSPLRRPTPFPHDPTRLALLQQGKSIPSPRASTGPALTVPGGASPLSWGASGLRAAPSLRLPAHQQSRAVSSHPVLADSARNAAQPCWLCSLRLQGPTFLTLYPGRVEAESPESLRGKRRAKPLPAALPALWSGLVGLTSPQASVSQQAPWHGGCKCFRGPEGSDVVGKRFCSRGSGPNRLTGYRLLPTREKLPSTSAWAAVRCRCGASRAELL
uniref:intraflagellar transport protein 20 homolog isoform X2 n=1 Tax=Callithrix jacchus TaxID=9483 RepID=UPI0023DD43C6|nr:intraflagellar transport protein 20 homolog isoform X2 [Callithrix jacchus]